MALTEMYEEEGNKIVLIDWHGAKRILYFFVVFIFIIVISINIFVDDVTINGVKQHYTSFKDKIPLLSQISLSFIFGFVFMFLFLHPRRIFVKRNANGDIFIQKRGSFYTKTEYFIKSKQKPVFVAKRGYAVGGNLYANPMYQTFIRYKDGEEEKEVSLILLSHYLPMIRVPLESRINEDGIEEVANFLGLELIKK